MLWALFLGSIGNAQEASIISFDAPGADTTAGDYNGTYPSGINYWGAITGAYIDANNVWHGFLRVVTASSPRSKLRARGTELQL